MNDADALNGNGDDAKVTPWFLAALSRFYTVEMLEDWIAQADKGMRVRDGQVAHWQRALAWLRSEQEQIRDGQ